MEARYTAAVGVLALWASVTGCGDGGGPMTAEPAAGIAELRCRIELGLTDTAKFASLDARVGYADAPGTFVAGARGPECRQLLRSVSFGASDRCAAHACADASERALRMSISGGSREISGPAAVARCAFAASSLPSAADFRVEVVDAAGADLSAVPSPGFAVTDVACAPEGASTTTSSTTTTLAPCDDAACPVGEHCFDGACEPSQRYEVEVFLDDDVELGAVQVDLTYECALGDFVGTNRFTECAPNPELPVGASFNDRPASDGCKPFGRLTAGMYTLSAIRGPVALFTCVYQARGGAVPHVEDFTVTVVDASGPDITPAVPTPVVRISSIRPR